MPRNRRFFHTDRNSDEEEEFETEALASLNKPKAQTQSTVEIEEDSEPDLQDSDAQSDSDKEGLLDDDDDVPESVGFSVSKESALLQLRQAVRHIDSQKQKKRQQRQLQDKQFREQKERKLAALSKVRLPEEFLEEIERPVAAKKRKKMTRTSELESDHVYNNFGDEPEAVEERLTGLEEDNGDYLSLSTNSKRSGVTVVSQDTENTAALPLAQAAAHFKQNRLFRSGIQRESVKSKQAKATKRRARFW